MLLKRVRLLAVACVIASAGASQGAVVFNFDTIITGSAPSGSNIATMTISDSGLNQVLITLNHNATSASGQFISNLWFNIDPFGSVVQSGQSPANKFDGPLSFGLNTEQNAGLNFDAAQGFITSNSGGGINRLKPGESISFTLTGTGLDSTDFLSAAIPNGGNRNDVFAMIHLQGLPGGQSVKLGAVVPEPATLSALALGGLLVLRRRRKA